MKNYYTYGITCVVAWLPAAVSVRSFRCFAIRDLSSASCRLCSVIPYVDEDVKWTSLRTLSYDIVKNSKVYSAEKVSLFAEFITRIAGTDFEMETCDAHVHLCVAY